MALKQLFKKWSWLFGLIGFSIVVTAIFVLPQYLMKWTPNFGQVPKL